MRPRTAHVLLVAAAGLLALSGCASGSPAGNSSAPSSAPASATADASDCSGVGIVIDAGTLDTGKTDLATSTCVDTKSAIGAADALSKAGITTKGTDQYPDEVVCRVNGEPSADTVIPAPDGTDYRETCGAMPAAFAYWSIWTKPSGGEWAYATEGLSTLQLKPGEQLELLFQINEQPATPSP
ncbi:hypothetical protein [Glaciibacter flavus]|uniref:hypothetical protein n=1 Tax=Orlajensenia flava TaxID=2565934 RepID=UPI003B00868F